MMLIELLSNPPSFVIFALLGGMALAIVSAPLGVFMVWQKQSYFGATLAHSALLGVSLGLFLQLDLTFSIIAVSLSVALLIQVLQKHIQLSSDTLLGLLAHSTLALGLIILSLQDAVQIDFMSYLFGDLLSLNALDLWMMLGLMVMTFAFFKHHWQHLLNITLNPELAQVEGTPVQKVQLFYVLLLALTIAFAMKMVGVLLITSLLIIPAAAARRLAKTPEQMLGYSLLISLLSVIGGIFASLIWDIPTGAAIVAVASFIFVILLSKKQA